jgi:hypothetical protein
MFFSLIEITHNVTVGRKHTHVLALQSVYFVLPNYLYRSIFIQTMTGATDSLQSTIMRRTVINNVCFQNQVVEYLKPKDRR